MTTPLPNTPILIGGGQVVQRKPEDLKTALGPIDLMAEAVARAAQDAGLGTEHLEQADSLRVINLLTGIYEDPVAVLSKRLNVHPADTLYPPIGGNTPQTTINETAEALAEGTVQLAILCGAEALGSMSTALLQGIVPDWIERDGAEAGASPGSFEGTAEREVPYDFQRPINVYPLFENALRHHYGWTIEEHFRKLGELFSPFSELAADNPYAWFQRAYTPEEISTVTDDNRIIGFPYTKRMNSIIRVDQGAAVIMTTVGKAQELGIDPNRWVFLHGCADVNDHWLVTDRENYHSSPAIRLAGQKALDMAGCTIADIDAFDLYTCFPSAVQIARDELGIAHDDPRLLTVTGSMPYHGGAGNNYVMNAVATMMDKLRANPGSKGLCSGIGWYITKHTIGIYSTDPFEGEWQRDDPATLQAEINARPKPVFETEPNGRATVETYTVIHYREGPEQGSIVGRLEDDRRFLAVTPKDPALYERMMSEEMIGKTGRVTAGKLTNTFEFD